MKKYRRSTPSNHKPRKRNAEGKKKIGKLAHREESAGFEGPQGAPYMFWCRSKGSSRLEKRGMAALTGAKYGSHKS